MPISKPVLKTRRMDEVESVSLKISNGLQANLKDMIWMPQAEETGLTIFKSFYEGYREKTGKYPLITRLSNGGI